MYQMDARLRLVDVLSAGAAGFDELFGQVGLADAASLHAPEEFQFFGL